MDVRFQSTKLDSAYRRACLHLTFKTILKQLMLLLLLVIFPALSKKCFLSVTSVESLLNVTEKTLLKKYGFVYLCFDPLR